eukprot:TRINITY_DN104214_c0_g1_i1.p1 TRINITY_DN104214_c0_g1~~TRINITY_DN104214_c0_g1_i1.p1  ORF type:complete len:159 (-),score=24.58 TRINITY_DN104214_c0_g1_i1:222-698(-)
MTRRGIAGFCFLIAASVSCKYGPVLLVPEAVSDSAESQSAAVGDVDAALQSGLPVVVDFYAAWCGPCQAFATQVHEVAQQLTGRVKFLKVDVDIEREFAEHMEVEALPTVYYFRANEMQPVGKTEGYLSAADLLAIIKEHLLNEIEQEGAKQQAAGTV